MTCYLSEPGVEFEISTFFVNIFKNRSKFKKMKKTLLDNFILFLKINESHFLIKPNFCYAVQEKLDGYHRYWCISAKLHNFTKICGPHWIHLVFLIPEMYTSVHFCASLLSIMRCIRSHISFFRLGLTPTLRQKSFQCEIRATFPYILIDKNEFNIVVYGANVHTMYIIMHNL